MYAEMQKKLMDVFFAEAFLISRGQDSFRPNWLAQLLAPSPSSGTRCDLKCKDILKSRDLKTMFRRIREETIQNYPVLSRIHIT